jgi:N-acetylglutamate synthase-like GNAT family acetyltransferase
MEHKGTATQYQVNWRQYRFQASNALGLKAMEKEFMPFFSPHPSSHTSGRVLNEPLLGITALWKGQVVGLILVEKVNELQGLVVCWHVLKPQRGFKLGKQLISKMEKYATQQGIQQLSLSYRWDSASRPQINQALHHAGWKDLEKKLHLIKYSVDLFVQMPWCKNMVTLPEEYDIFPWSELTQHDENKIMARQKKEGWYPKEVPPIFDRSIFDHETSVGLRLRGEVVGWMMTHRVNNNIVEYSSLFVSPEIQRLGRGVHLIVAAISRQQVLGIQYGIFQVVSNNTEMCRFVEKRMKNTIISQTTRRYLDKSLK